MNISFRSFYHCDTREVFYLLHLVHFTFTKKFNFVAIAVEAVQ